MRASVRNGVRLLKLWNGVKFPDETEEIRGQRVAAGQTRRRRPSRRRWASRMRVYGEVRLGVLIYGLGGARGVPGRGVRARASRAMSRPSPVPAASDESEAKQEGQRGKKTRLTSGGVAGEAGRLGDVGGERSMPKTVRRRSDGVGRGMVVAVARVAAASCSRASRKRNVGTPWMARWRGRGRSEGPAPCRGNSGGSRW